MRSPEPKTIFALIVLTAGAVGSTYMADDFWKDDEPRSKPELSLAYYLNSAELMGTDEDGSILYQVWTERAEQTVDDESIAIKTVRMAYGPADALPWQLSARAGKIPADASVIELHGNVVAISGDNQNGATTIRTERLDIDPETLRANTTESVVIEYDGRTINAIGMQADFEANRLNLLSNVNGIFAP